jgi:soluble lytic murein transglycosylase-like protein
MIAAAAPHHLARFVELLARFDAPNSEQRLPPRRTAMAGARVVKNAARHTAVLVKNTLALIGLVAVGAAMLIPLDGDSFRRALPEGPAPTASLPALVSEGQVAAGRVATPLEREQRAVSEYIAKRYRVSESAVAEYVAVAYRAGAKYSLDPLLILAVMAIESRYNPVAESGVGARGLMQVMPKFHLEKLADHGGDADALLEPEVNIQVGARILREYQRRFHDMEATLQMYAGAFDEPTAQYANKVLAEKARLEVLREKARRAQSA